MSGRMGGWAYFQDHHTYTPKYQVLQRVLNGPLYESMGINSFCSVHCTIFYIPLVRLEKEINKLHFVLKPKIQGTLKVMLNLLDFQFCSISLSTIFCEGSVKSHAIPSMVSDNFAIREYILMIHIFSAISLIQLIQLIQSHISKFELCDVPCTGGKEVGLAEQIFCKRAINCSNFDF